jgi:hypothetical protein
MPQQRGQVRTRTDVPQTHKRDPHPDPLFGIPNLSSHNGR